MKCKRKLSRPVGRFGDDRGLILPLVLLVMIILGVLSSAILSIGGSEVQIASNHLGAIQADFLAEAGLEHAFNTLRTTPNLLSANVPASLTIVPGIANPSPLGGIGNYNVQYQAVGILTVRVVSTGTSAIGGFQKIRRATISTATFRSNDAILTQGPLSITGNPTVQGQCGSVHTNNNLSMTGNPSISGAATASGTYTVTGNPSVGPGSGGNKPIETIPVINPTDFLNAAKATLPANQVFQMKANGQVLDGNNNLIATLVSGGSYNGWRYTSGSPAQWSLSGNTGYNGTYYLEGNVTVSGNPGSTSTPWVTTLIATGDLIISGNPTIQTSVTDTLFIAGLDLRISGNPSLGFNGLIAAHEQFSLSGNATINGLIIAEDASATDNTVTSDTDSGNLTINYNCNLNPPLQGSLQILSWGL